MNDDLLDTIILACLGFACGVLAAIIYLIIKA